MKAETTAPMEIKLGINYAKALEIGAQLGVSIRVSGKNEDLWSYPGVHPCACSRVRKDCPAYVIQFLRRVQRRQLEMEHLSPSLQTTPSHLLTFSAGHAEAPPPPSPPTSLPIQETVREARPESPLEHLLLSLLLP